MLRKYISKETAISKGS